MTLMHTVIWLLDCVLILLACATTEAFSSKPNIIVILADDLGWDDVGFHGSKQIPTPNLDDLAYDGITLANYYVQPICTPSRAALLSGRHPIQLGLQTGVPMSSQPYGLGLNETILPQYLAKMGYTSKMVGKWHLGFFAREYTPTYRGFDSYFGFYNGHGDYYDHTFVGGGNYWGLDLHRDERGQLAMVKDKFGVYSTELFTQEAEDIIHNHNPSKPLFLYVAEQAVHAGNEPTKTPLEAPWKYVKKFLHIENVQRRLYAAMVSALDDSVGNITRALHAKGMLNNSVIVFSTDNGGPAAGYDKNHASNWPLRGMKYTQWEGGVRGTAFIWSPLLKRSGYVSRHRMQIEDLFPTLLHASGYDTATLPRDLYGKDLWETLSEHGGDVRDEMLHNIDPHTATMALRVGDMKVITAANTSNTARLDGWFPPEQVGGWGPAQPEMIWFPAEDQNGGSNLAKVGRIEDGENGVRSTTPGGAAMSWFPGEDWDDWFPSSESLYSEGVATGSGVGTAEGIGEGGVTEPGGLGDILASLGRRSLSSPRRPLTVNCGPRPRGQNVTCDVTRGPCLFNITADPCEYRNLASRHPQIVARLRARLQDYVTSAAPPRNKPLDPLGDPRRHGGMWVPWVVLPPASFSP